MKKNLLLLLFLIPICLSSQTEHLRFKNIPITGKLNAFISNLETQGFQIQYEKDNAVVLTGEFVDSNCDIYVLSTPISDIVWKVVVNLSENESWYSLKSDYKRFIKQYTEKYGKPDSHYEFFVDPYYEGDGYEIQALRREKCKYITFWELNNGSIAVKISESAQISFAYEDAINAKIKSKETNRKVQDDI